MLPLYPAHRADSARIDNRYLSHIWGEGYVQINEQGEVCIHPCVDAPGIALNDVIKRAHEQQVRLPLLVRFPQIIEDRVRTLADAFKSAQTQCAYQGDYFPVYPIKVNQQKAVVDAVVQGQLGCGLPPCLEAGSKPELIAVLAQTQGKPSLIVCNGYKDAHYIRLALMAQKLGHHVFLVIEKPSELPLILAEASALEVTPMLGVRARLATMGKGNWQNTGGEKSKFGLSAHQMLQLIEQLKAHDALQSLVLLHVHLGSQLANLDDIRRGVKEAAHIYQALVGQGADLMWVDVGGGLGVDYEGARSSSAYSIEYELNDYALVVIQAFLGASSVLGRAHPNIISESGRAMTAHHAVLLAQIIDNDPHNSATPQTPGIDACEASQRLWHQFGQASSDDDGVTDWYARFKQARADIAHIQKRFSCGEASLAERANGEALYGQIANAVLRHLRRVRHRLDDDQQRLLGDLEQTQADKVFVNFSLFQSLPDIWGIDQIFPITPLCHVRDDAKHQAILQDITCDSDGRIDAYVASDHALSLPLPSIDVGTALGFFLVGAYQEILGDMHNLFGDTDALDVWVEPEGVRFGDRELGDTIGDVLDYVHQRRDGIGSALKQQVEHSTLSNADKARLDDELSLALSAYTYLELTR